MSPDPAAAATIPRLPPAAAVRMPSGGTVTERPAPAGGVPGSGMSSFQRALMEYQMSLQPPATAKPQKNKGDGAKRGLKLLLILAMVAGLGAGGWYVVRKYVLTSDLPTFSHRPEYGSVTKEITEPGIQVHVVADASMTVFDWTVDQGVEQMNAQHILGSDRFVFVQTPDGAWYRAQRSPEADQLAHIGGFVWFNDFVPDALRPFVKVVETRDTSVQGHSAARYELGFDMVSFAAEEPAAHAEYVSEFGVEPSGLLNVAITVDGDGVIWRLETWDSVNPSGRTVVRVISLSPELPQVTYPTTFVDGETGALIG